MSVISYINNQTTETLEGRGMSSISITLVEDYRSGEYKNSLASFTRRLNNGWRLAITNTRGHRAIGITEHLLGMVNERHQISPLNNMFINDLLDVIGTDKPVGWLPDGYDPSDSGRTVPLVVNAPNTKIQAALGDELTTMYRKGGIAYVLNTLLMYTLVLNTTSN